MDRILSITLSMPVRPGRRFSRIPTNRRHAANHCAPNEEPGAFRPSPKISPLRRQHHHNPRNHGPARRVETVLYQKHTRQAQKKHIYISSAYYGEPNPGRMLKDVSLKPSSLASVVDLANAQITAADYSS